MKEGPTLYQSDISPVYIGPESLDELSLFLKQAAYSDSKLIILADENMRRHCLPLLADKVSQVRKATVITIPPGEAHKNTGTSLFFPPPKSKK